MPRRPLSDKQLAANRANARKSTGPRTPAGKARSRWNAYKHGARAESCLAPGESAADLAALREHFFAGLPHASAHDRALAESIVRLYWRLGRVMHAEGEALAAAQGTPPSDVLDRLLRYDVHLEHRLYKLLEAVPHRTSQRAAWPPTPAAGQSALPPLPHRLRRKR